MIVNGSSHSSVAHSSVARPERLYLDNAATSSPKPEAVFRAMMAYASGLGATTGRGAYAEAREGGRLVRQCRQRLARLLGGRSVIDSPDNVVFTLNTSDALNLAIHGVVLAARRRLPGRSIHLIATEMDHNSVLRPCAALARQGVEWTCVPVNPRTQTPDADAIVAAIRPDTVMVCVNHASNVTGAILPVEPIARVCRERGVLLLVDAAQSAGHVPIDVDSMGIDLLAFPGHKGLLGPQGTGGLIIRPGVEDRVDAVRQGGTGNRSELDEQPTFLPDKYEPGSQNTPGIIGLSEGVAWILDRGVSSLRAHEMELCGAMLGQRERLASAGFELLGDSSPPESRIAVFSFVHPLLDAHTLATLLELQSGVLCRAGLHCAPRIHRAMGSQSGALRLSFGAFNSPEHVERACDAMMLAAEQASGLEMAGLEMAQEQPNSGVADSAAAAQ
ncbi:MAG: aminotransferase class V-fold PLP-dependent enzyme [Planctomycetota bacterium]|nr:aminotransferase class V-fold PLP-dependent enzyme [Planctomycetota bacterium]